MLFLDFLKVLRFSFPVPVVGPSAEDFYPRRNFPPVGLSNHERFYWCAVNQTRSRHMKSDLNCFELCIFCGLYFGFVLSPVSPKIQSFNGRFIFLYLSTSPRPDFPGSHGAKKHYRSFCFARALQSCCCCFFYFLCFPSWRIQTLQQFLRTWTTLMKGQARNVWRLNSQISQDGTFVLYRFLYWTFLYLLYFIIFTFFYRFFFLLFVCFDILWQLATTYARDDTRDRDANSSCQNDITWCDFLQGK